jgi:hypothetical protein
MKLFILSHLLAQDHQFAGGMDNEPVRRSTECNTIWTVGQRPDFSDDNPCARSPGVSEVNDEKPDHDNGSPSSTLVVWPVVRKAGDDAGNDEMASSHADRTGNEDRLTTPAIDVHNSRNYATLDCVIYGNRMGNTH